MQQISKKINALWLSYAYFGNLQIILPWAIYVSLRYILSRQYCSLIFYFQQLTPNDSPPFKSPIQRHQSMLYRNFRRKTIADALQMKNLQLNDYQRHNREDVMCSRGDVLFLGSAQGQNSEKADSVYIFDETTMDDSNGNESNNLWVLLRHRLLKLLLCKNKLLLVPSQEPMQCF